jgi:hypothetical protein
MEKVDVLVIGAGANWRVDYIPSSFQLQYYSYYDCADSLKYIQVWFNNDSTHLIAKYF